MRHFHVLYPDCETTKESVVSNTTTPSITTSHTFRILYLRKLPRVIPVQCKIMYFIVHVLLYLKMLDSGRMTTMQVIEHLMGYHARC